MFVIWKKYPKVWEEMKDIELRLLNLQEKGEKIIYNNFHMGKTCLDMEKKFKEVDKQCSLFDFSDEPLKDCFCKI